MTRAPLLSFQSAIAESSYRDVSWGVTQTRITVSEIAAPTARLDRERKNRFDELVRQWSDDTMHVSSISDLHAHPAYQAIIEMGLPVIGLLLGQLRREPDLWFEALRRISGANPVRAEDAGDLARMTQAWLDWGEQHGYA